MKDRGTSCWCNKDKTFITPKTDNNLLTGITITPTKLKIDTTKEAKKIIETLEISTGGAKKMIETIELILTILGMSDPLKYKDINDSNKESFLKEINFTSKDLEIMHNQKISDQWEITSKMISARVTGDLPQGMKVILKIGHHLDHRKTLHSRKLNEVGVAAMINPKQLSMILLKMQGRNLRRNHMFLSSNRRRVMKANKNKNNGAGKQMKSQLQIQNQWMLKLYFSQLINNFNRTCIKEKEGIWLIRVRINWDSRLKSRCYWRGFRKASNGSDCLCLLLVKVIIRSGKIWWLKLLHAHKMITPSQLHQVWALQTSNRFLKTGSKNAWIHQPNSKFKSTISSTKP